MALLFNALFGWHLSIASFTLVGMAGVMSGVMKAPLTSIFLIAELSSGYGLFIPLMIVACISFAVDYYLDPDSIYTKQLRLSGDLLTHDKDQSVFVFLKLEELMETDFYRIRETFTLGDIVHVISHARRNIFPVIDDFGPTAFSNTNRSSPCCPSSRRTRRGCCPSSTNRTTTWASSPSRAS